MRAHEYTEESTQTYYHGTDVEFSRFKTDSGAYWFTPDKLSAQSQGKNVIAVTLNVKNPYRWEIGDPEPDSRVFRDYLVSKGYDGVIAPSNISVEDDVIVFSPKQITPIDPVLAEDWKNWAAGLGAAATMAGVGGGLAYDHAQNQPAAQPQAKVQQVRAPQAKVQAPVAQQPQAITQQHVELAKDLLASAPAQLLAKVAQQAGIKGAELTQFLAQTAHESANFKTTKEFGDRNYFKKYDIKFNPAKAKELGNLRPGDGERYKGRGFIQLTGKYNYEKAGQALGLPLAQKPELAERPDVAAKVAVWFWKNRVQPNVSNFNDTPQATKPINPGMKGLADRDVKFRSMKQALTQPQMQKVAAKAPQVKVAQKPAAKPAAKVAQVPAKPTKGKKV